MSESYQKPIPVIQPWSEGFWKGTKEHKLLIQECNECKVKIFYPRKACPKCWSSDLGWTEARGKAKVYTYTIMKDMVEAKFQPDLPYVLAIVQLEEGVNMMTRIVECDPEEVTFDMDVEVVFEDITDECSLPLFRPVKR